MRPCNQELRQAARIGDNQMPAWSGKTGWRALVCNAMASVKAEASEPGPDIRDRKGNTRIMQIDLDFVRSQFPAFSVPGLSEQAFYLVGTIDEAIAKAKTLKS